MERNIRDVRDIFGGKTDDKQELRSYDYSPRSRRRHEAMDNYESRLAPHHHHNSESRSSVATGNSKKSNRHRADDLIEPVRQSKKSDDNQKSSSSKNNKDAAYYANRTLTERDIRHLERHLSMKKTIRKQISRNLTQAFVDDPELVLMDTNNQTTKSNNSKVSADRTFTLTRAKVSKSEQNVLDLLKDNEPDSGHCSADNPNSSDDDSHQEQVKERHVVKSTDKNNTKMVHDNRGKAEANYNKDDGKFSFWKMFSVKNRGKR
ncbi:uncharacterized protein TNIN_177811 [Trichonephila inaurata madagascariensis]|uniref:Uncharacterized protein n=1 Tax=Trichonephila inaurata madagascariensis TaxID=2747483 RepID=A0A8X7BY01_9ARAC|nr:uncharacterized protein TNIN_177811 [Trichonephila inaurata madagascariensis]